MRSHSSSLRSRRGSRGGSIAEFGPVLYVFFIVVLLPLIGFFSFLDGVVTLVFTANASSRAAATGSTAGQAFNASKNIANQILGGGFANFGGINPNNANSNTNFKVTLLELPVTGGPPLRQAELPGLMSGINTTNNFYLMEAKLSYTLHPLFIPGDYPLSFAATAACEHPDGMNTP